MRRKAINGLGANESDPHMGPYLIHQLGSAKWRLMLGEGELGRYIHTYNINQHMSGRE